MRTVKLLSRLESRVCNRLYRMSYWTKAGAVKSLGVLERSYARAKAAAEGQEDFAKLVRKRRER